MKEKKDNADKSKTGFTATEVGTLIEEFKTDLSLVSERVGSLCEDMVEVKKRLSHLETDVTTIKDTLRITLPDHSRRLAKLEAKAGV